MTLVLHAWLRLIAVTIAALIVVLALSVGIRWATAPRLPVCEPVHFQGINIANGKPEEWGRLACSP